MSKKLIFTPLALLALLLTNLCWADIPLDGYFIAQDNCPATTRIKVEEGVTPDARLTEDMTYELISKNKSAATHYRIQVKGVSPQERWVPISCGVIVDASCIGSKTDPDPGPNPDPKPSKEYLLAVSWQPAFCETHRSKSECEDQDEQRYDADHFALHGLWPQPKGNDYCGVSNVEKNLDKAKAWSQLPSLGLSEDLYADLTIIMPGVASYLQRHEWIKHGTCYSADPEEYFRESIMLVEQLNDDNNKVRKLFATNIEKEIKLEDVKAAFNDSFGAGAGDKLTMKCSQGMITELWINLKGEIDANSTLADLLQDASPAATKCRSGKVDRAGF